MKAAVYRRYGGPEVIEIADVPKPVPKDNEVLVRVHAATVTPFDCRLRSLALPGLFRLAARLIFGIRRPTRAILGYEFSGVVEAVGARVARFKSGDALFGFADGKAGTHAEYCLVTANAAVAIKPASVSFVEAAAIPYGGCDALQSLRAASVRRGETMLVLGASGVSGSALVRLASDFGAVVTAVSNEDPTVMTGLGARQVITYQEFKKGSETYDVVADAAGWTSFSATKHALNENGRFVYLRGRTSSLIAKVWPWRKGGKRVVIGVPIRAQVENLRVLAELAGAGRFRPLIDQIHVLDRIREAHVRVEQRRSHGSVVVRMVADVEYAGTAEGRLETPGYDLHLSPASGGEDVLDRAAE